jgi:hypothetical protein
MAMLLPVAVQVLHLAALNQAILIGSLDADEDLLEP